MPRKNVNVRRHSRWTTTGKRAKVRRHSRNIKVPPAWKNVKYYDDQPYVATGIDSKGRLQRIYPESETKKNAAKKFKRVERLHKKKQTILNKIVKDVNKDNTEAEVVYTMFKTGFRPGSDRDTKADKPAFGASNLLKEHVKVKPGNKVEFKFTGKKGVEIDKEVTDKKLAGIMKEKINNPKLFDTNTEKVREYFDKTTDGQFKLKDIRTVKGFDTADKALEKAKGKEPNEIKKIVAEAVSKDLGNTPPVAITSYVAPKIKNVG